MRERDEKEKVAIMHMFNKKKRKFLNDWANLSVEKSVDNIKYLLENYRKYNITLQNDDKVLIDNVIIRKDKADILGYTCDVYVVNNRIFTIDGFVGQYITQLIDCCKNIKDEKTLMEKLEQFVKKNKFYLYYIFLAICLAIACFKVFCVSEKSKQNEEKQQEQLKKVINVKKQQANLKTLQFNQKTRGL